MLLSLVAIVRPVLKFEYLFMRAGQEEWKVGSPRYYGPRGQRDIFRGTESVQSGYRCMENGGHLQPSCPIGSVKHQ